MFIYKLKNGNEICRSESKVEFNKKFFSGIVEIKEGVKKENKKSSSSKDTKED